MMQEVPEVTEASTERGIGDNLPPVSITDRLHDTHKQIFDRWLELKDSYTRVPTEYEDETTHEKLLDLVKMMRKCANAAEQTRKNEKEPYANMAAEVDGVFHRILRPMKKAIDDLRERGEKYAEIKAERERQEREAKAEQERIEAERKAEEARKAEQERLESEKKERLERETAERARLEQLESERKAREAKEQADKAARDAAWADGQKRDEARKKAEAAKAEQRRAAEEAERKRQTAREAESKAKTHHTAAKQHERTSKTNLNLALKKETRANRLDQKARASDAELSRARSDLGSVGSLGSQWVGTIEDFDAIPLDKIRGFISHEAIQVAVNLYVRAGGRDLPGVRIEQEQSLRVK